MTDHTIHAGDGDALRERERLWRGQLLFAAAQAAGTIGLLWLSAARGGGPAAAALILAAGVLPLAVGTAPAAVLVAHASRRVVLWGAQAAAAVALAAIALAPAGTSPLVMASALAAVGCARAAFDAAAADILQQLVPPGRKHDAMRDLTRRYGAGYALGSAGTLGAGLLAGPGAAVLLAACCATAGAAQALRHGWQIDLRPDGAVPLHRALRAGARLAWRDRALRPAVLGGAVGVGIGGALSAILILWLRDGVGLRGSLVPTLALGLVLVRVARPAVVRGARRIGSRALVVTALGIQAAAAVTAHEASGMPAAAAAFALSLASGAFLATLIMRAHRRAAPADVAPAVAAVCGAVWGLAAATGAGVGAALALTLGLADAYLALALLAAAGMVAALAPGLRPARARA